MSVLDQEMRKALGREGKPLEELGKGGVSASVEVKHRKCPYPA
jgi:hypothetical protein